MGRTDRIDTGEFPAAVAAGWSRRRFLTGTTAAATLALTVGRPQRSEARIVEDALPYPYTLGIASGDPLPDAVVIWTRLAPKPLEPYGGMAQASWRVEWEVAEDPQFSRRVLRGRTLAHPEYYHSVHVDVRGLRPGRVYYYRFKAGGQVSETGRTKTAPAADSDPAKINFAVASCQAFQDGYYTALRHLGQEDLDAVLFLGDYIYETGMSPDGGGLHEVPEPLPPEFKADAITLERYRLQYSLYKSEPDLIAAHLNTPWIATWDDHEVTSNYVSLDSDSWNEPIDFAVQRANAYRAYWEHMPLRLPEPDGPDLKLYRRFSYGRLAQFDVIDTRQYRDDQAPGSGDSAVRRDPSRTVLGAAQEQWLLDGLADSPARWNFLPQQIPMAQLDSAGGAALSLNMDAWDGYVPARQRILDAVRDGVDNFVVLTGDAHTNYALQLLEDFDDLESAPIGVELVGTSISSDRDGTDTTPALQTRLVENPHLKFANQQRGYLLCQVTPEALTTDFKIVPYVTRRDAPISVRQRIVVESGSPELILDSSQAV